MAKTVDINLVINTAGSEKSVAQAKDAIVQLQRELKNLGSAADDAFVNKTNNAIAQSKAQLQDLKDEIDSVRPDRVGSAFLTLGQSIAGSFQLASGAIVAFGGESKEIEKVQTQLLAITNIAGGLGNLKETTEDFSRSFQVLNTVVKANPLLFFVGALITVFGLLASKSKFLQDALNGIFISIGQVGEVIDDAVVSFSQFVDELSGYEEAEKGLADATKQNTAEIEKQSEKLREQQQIIKERNEEFATGLFLANREISLLQAQGASKDKILQAELKGLKQREEQLVLFGNQEGETLRDNQLRQEIIGAELTTFYKDQGEKRSEQNKTESEKQLADLEDFDKKVKNANELNLNEFQEIQADAFQEEEELRDAFRQLVFRNDEKGRELKKQKELELAEAIRLIELDAITKTNELKKQKEEEVIQAEKDKQQKLSDVRQLGFENQLLQLELDGQLTKDKELEIERQKFEDLKAQTAEGSEERKALELEYRQTVLDITKKYNDAELEDDKRKSNQKTRNLNFGVQAAVQAANLISDIATKFAGKSEKAARKAFNISKAAQIAAALGSTYLSATQAYASQIIPFDPTSPVRGAIAAGLAVAAGLANVAKISQTKFEGGSTSGGGGGGNLGGDLGGGNIPNTATPATPQASIANQQIGAINQQGFKVFVTETDITSVINKVDVIESQSKFG